jgi:glycerophosphoryl diester phosphodiesterase
MRWIKRLAGGLSFLVVAVLALRYFPGPAPPAPARFEVIAHRGVHHTGSSGGSMTECTATSIFPVEHFYIENTLPSMQAAFDHGATMVEIDIHPTADDGMIVFHDWTVDCRTEGKGQTDEQTVAYLKSLDVGYGYTSDGGKTFPLRGSGVGMMPTLQELLDHFPERHFLINQKDRYERTLELLAGILAHYPPEQRGRLHYWGPLPDLARRRVPDMGQAFHNRASMKQCAKAFVLGLGLVAFPVECHANYITLPTWVTPYIWGWPHRFLTGARMSGAPVFLYLNTPEEGPEVPQLPIDGVATDRIEVIGPWLRSVGRIPEG